MDLSALFPAAPSYFPSLLGEEQARLAQQQAQQQGLLGAALGLLSAGGPSRTPVSFGQSLAQGLQAGQQAYTGALQQRVQEQMLGQQIAEMQKKRQQQEAMQKLFPQVFQRTGGEEGQPVRYSIDPSKLSLLAATSADPLSALKTIGETTKTLREAGLTTQPLQQDNPFELFANDTTLPESLRAVAQRYYSSFSSGLLPPDKIDERIRQLGDAAQRSATNKESLELRKQQMEQSLKLAQSQQEMTGLIAAGQQDISRGMLELRREQAAATQAEKERLQREEQAKKDDAREQFKVTLSNMMKNYDTLLKEGAIVSTQSSALENLGARSSVSGTGRAIGAAIGSVAEQQRQTIEQTRPLLLNLIKNATGMSAQQMNSNAEMQLYLNAATNPALGYEANMEAMANLDRLFGTGDLAKQIEQKLQSSRSRTGRSQW
jgi:hypothetical protein